MPPWVDPRSVLGWPAPGDGISTAVIAPGDDRRVAPDGDGLWSIIGWLESAIGHVTVEEFRVEDFRCERDTRLGRQVLFLLSSTDWTRRTTELVSLNRVRSVDTEVVVDVDLSYAVHSGLRPEAGRIWLPLITMPSARPARTGEQASTAASRWLRRRSAPPALPPDPVTSLEVTDAAGARVPKVPQTEIQHWLGAAMAELLLNRMPRGTLEWSPAESRDERVLLAAAIRRMMSGRMPPGRDGDDSGLPAGPMDIARMHVGERLGPARAGLGAAVQADLARARPALRSRIGDMLAALVDTVFVVISVDRASAPTSFAVRVPSRRLDRMQRRGPRLSPRARLRIDLLTASGNTDRLIRLSLPDGVGYLPPAEPSRHPPVARIEVQEPQAFAELRALVAEVTADLDGPVSWAQRRLASMAEGAVDACLAVLAQYRVTPRADPGGDGANGGRASGGRASGGRASDVEAPSAEASSADEYGANVSVAGGDAATEDVARGLGILRSRLHAVLAAADRGPEGVSPPNARWRRSGPAGPGCRAGWSDGCRSTRRPRAWC